MDHIATLTALLSVLAHCQSATLLNSKCYTVKGRNAWPGCLSSLKGYRTIVGGQDVWGWPDGHGVGHCVAALNACIDSRLTHACLVATPTTCCGLHAQLSLPTALQAHDSPVLARGHVSTSCCVVLRQGKMSAQVLLTTLSVAGGRAMQVYTSANFTRARVSSWCVLKHYRALPVSIRMRAPLSRLLC